MEKRIEQYILLKTLRRTYIFIPKTYFCLLFTCFVLLFGFNHFDLADANTDLTELSLEELMLEDVILIDVMGAHIHFQGEWMVGFKEMIMVMGGNRSGTTDATEDEVLNDFMVTPLDMTTRTEMLEIMYGLTDKTTLMVMLPYIQKSMDHINRGGVTFNTKSRGVGDLRLMAHIETYNKGGHHWILIPSMSLPTGSINKEDDTPAAVNGGRLPYPMQLGSGTIDLLPGVLYFYERGKWVLLGNVQSVLRLGKNANKYQLGDRHMVSGLIQYKLSEKFSGTVGLKSHIWGNINGADQNITPTMVPTADANRRKGERIDLLFGLNFFESKKRDSNSGHRFGIEFGFPIYQSLEGPQLEVDWISQFSWNYTF